LILVFAFTLVSLFVPAAPDGGSATVPQWTKNVTRDLGLRRFDNFDTKTWTQQQGVAFLSSTRLAVYQVVRSEQVPALQARSESGGAGSFQLRIVILDVESGREIHHLELPTNAEQASVLPTTEAKFLVRTGNTLYLYSPDFERLATRLLPSGDRGNREEWQVRVSPSGSFVFLAHKLVFESGDKDRIEVQMLDASNLELLRTIPVSFLAFWSAGDDFLISKTQSTRDEYASVSLDGNWHPLLQDDPYCAHLYTFRALPSGNVAEVSCGFKARVIDSSGKVLHSFRVETSQAIDSVQGGDGFLAAQVFHRKTDSFGNGHSNHQGAIWQFRLGDSDPCRAVSAKYEGVRYTLGQKGALAVVDGESLSFFPPIE